MTDAGAFRVAVIQAAPVFMDLDATLDKACGLIEQAAAPGAKLVAFPEAFVAGYPLWVWFIPPGHTHPLREVFTELHAISIAIPDPATDRLCQAAGDCGVPVAIGVNERNAEASDSTIYKTLLWHIAKEGRCVVLSPCQSFHIDDVPDRMSFKAAYLGEPRGLDQPGSERDRRPRRENVAGPLEEEEGILQLDLQPHQLVGPRWQLDAGGHYARPDVFELSYHRRATPMLTTIEEEPADAERVD